MFCAIFTQSSDAFWGPSNILKINCKAVSTTASSKKIIVIKEYRCQFSGPKILPQSNQNYSAEIAPTET